MKGAKLKVRAPKPKKIISPTQRIIDARVRSNPGLAGLTKNKKR